jgi:hypothetical protein
MDPFSLNLNSGLPTIALPSRFANEQCQSARQDFIVCETESQYTGLFR